MSPETEVIVLLLLFHGLDGNSVKLADHGRMVQAILQNLLAISDRLKIIMQARQDHIPGHLEDKFVAPRHRVEQGVQRQVFGERFLVPRQRPL